MKREKTLYELLLLECIDKDINMVELAKRLGVTRATLNNIKRTRPSTKTYHKLSKYFNMTPEEIYYMPIKQEGNYDIEKG